MTTSRQTFSATWIRMPLPLQILIVLIFNTVIALFLTAIGFGGTLLDNLVSAQCIGFSIYTSATLAGHLWPGRAVWLMPLAVLFGAVMGAGLALVATGLMHGEFYWPADMFVQVVLIGLLFGAVATWFFLQRGQLADVHEALQESRIRQLLVERERVTMQLRLLQAQIEPHFLFNSLANVDSLLQEDVQTGRQLLRRLIDYLRSSLRHSRREQATLGDELEVIRAYLDIMAVRMGGRLQWREQLEPGVQEVPLAPMLLQPLVENAIRHGLEPGTGSGRLEIHARREGNMLEIRIVDNGVGLGGNGGSGGVGLSNVRERLSVLYDGNASLVVEENPAGGVCARVVLPLPAGTAA